MIKHAAGAVGENPANNNGRLFPIASPVAGGAGGGGAGKGTMAFATSASGGAWAGGGSGVGDGRKQEGTGRSVVESAAAEGELLAPDGSIVNKTHIAM